jgi:hypothetical protein
MESTLLFSLYRQTKSRTKSDQTVREASLSVAAVAHPHARSHARVLSLHVVVKPVLTPSLRCCLRVHGCFRGLHIHSLGRSPLLMALRVCVLAALLASALGVDEFLTTCSSAPQLGPQDSTPQSLLFVEIGAADGNSSFVSTASCSAGVQTAVAALQSYLTAAGRGDRITYLALNNFTVPPDLASVDQIWVRCVGSTPVLCVFVGTQRSGDLPRHVALAAAGLALPPCV